MFDKLFYLMVSGCRSRADLANLPLATPPQELPRAGHPAYQDQPLLWHTLLANFITALSS